MNMKLGLISTIASTLFLASTPVFADSLSDYNNARAKCGADQTARNNGYNATYNKASDAASKVLAQQQNDQAAAYASDQQTAQTDRDNQKSDAQNAATTSDQAARNVYDASSKGCSDSATLDYALAVDSDTLSVANARADNTYTKQVNQFATYDKTYPGDQSTGDYELAVGQANAALQRDLTTSEWTKFTCDDNAWAIYSNALLSQDCAATPANCCKDNAGKTYNNAVLQADTALANAVSPASPTININILWLKHQKANPTWVPKRFMTIYTVMLQPSIVTVFKNHILRLWNNAISWLMTITFFMTTAPVITFRIRKNLQTVGRMLWQRLTKI